MQIPALCFSKCVNFLVRGLVLAGGGGWDAGKGEAENKKAFQG